MDDSGLRTQDSGLLCGNNLDLLREHVADASVDLIYADPPFNSGKAYFALEREAWGTGREALGVERAATEAAYMSSTRSHGPSLAVSSLAG